MLALALAIAAISGDTRIVAHVPQGSELVEGTLRFSKNGAKCACVVSKDGKTYPLTGDTLGASFDDVDAPVLDPSGAHVAFRAHSLDAKKKLVYSAIYDGKVIASDEWVGPIALSPIDGAPAFWSGRGHIIDTDGIFSDGPGLLLWGKRKSKKWARVDLSAAPVFGFDGKTIYGISSRDDDWRVVSLDDKGKEERQGGGDIYQVAISPKGGVAMTMCRIYRANKKVLVLRVVREQQKHAKPDETPLDLDDLKYELEESHSEASPVFSADGAHLAFKVEIGGKFGVGVDVNRKVKCEFDFVDELAPHPKDGSVLYVACTGCKLDRANGRELLDGVHAKSGQWFVVHGETKLGEFEGARFPTWSPDGSRFAFAARKDGKWRVACGAKESDPCDEIACIVWTADGKSVGYGCRVGGDLCWKTLELD